MVNLLSVSIHAVNSAAPEQFPITIEAVEAHDQMPAYYRMMFCGVWCVITDAHRRQICDVLSSAPPLPKTDAQIDAEAEDAAPTLPGQGDVEIPAAGHRNAAVAEPLRGILNAISPEVRR